MKILASWSGETLIHFGVLELLGTAFLCYGLAVANGHVPAWLPMISDCAVLAPEKYPFRLGMVTGALLVALLSVTVYYKDENTRYNKLSAVFGLIAAAGLGVVGVVNEEEDPPVHDAAAVILFVAFNIYMLLKLFAGYQFSLEKVSCLSFFIKVLCSSLGIVALVGYILTKYFPIPTSSIYLAIFEWSNFLVFCVFVWSFSLDNMKTVSLAEIMETQERKSYYQLDATILPSLNKIPEKQPIPKV